MSELKHLLQARADELRADMRRALFVAAGLLVVVGGLLWAAYA